MTKRDVAAIAVRILAGYNLIMALTTILGLPSVFWPLSTLITRFHSLHPNTPLLVVSAIISPVWGLITALAFWLLAGRIALLILPQAESATIAPSLSHRGWFSTAALLLGVQLLATGLGYAALGVPVLHWGAKLHGTAATVSRLDDGYHYLMRSGAQLLLGACLVYWSARVGRWLVRDNDAQDTADAFAALIGVRLISTRILLSGFGHLTLMAAPAISRQAVSPAGRGHGADWVMLLIPVGVSVWYLAVGLLTWFLAPRLANLINRGCSQNEPEAPTPVTSA